MMSINALDRPAHARTPRGFAGAERDLSPEAAASLRSYPSVLKGDVA